MSGRPTHFQIALTPGSICFSNSRATLPIVHLGLSSTSGFKKRRGEGDVFVL